MEQKIKLQEGLPFLYGWKWYPWARQFFESTNKINLLCAANQISKSSTQIRKCIDWATNQAKWPSLWARKPVQFWYLYPTSNQATAEFTTKWQQFLPQGEFKDHPIYGWKEEKRHGNTHAIHFNSGVHLFFKTYAQDVMSLQTGTCDALFCDEELPTDIYDELMFRISASDGYFHMVFTATLGQDFWRQVMEPEADEEELLPMAHKQSVSMYECMEYEDGTPSHWTLEKIQQVEARCKNHEEVLRRIYGKFILTRAGRKYEQFDAKRHMKDAHPLPKDWVIYAGVDVGSGGKEGHASAICFVAVRPDFSEGRVFLGWRGDGIPTTSSVVVDQFISMKSQAGLKPVAQFYDWASSDFFQIATGMGEVFTPADKSHSVGEDVINTLFKNDMLYIYRTPELQKLSTELSKVRKETAKNKAKDDLCDAMRYAITRIPWNWGSITAKRPENQVAPAPLLSPEQLEIQARRAMVEHQREEDRIEREFEELNELYEM